MLGAPTKRIEEVGNFEVDAKSGVNEFNFISLLSGSLVRSG